QNNESECMVISESGQYNITNNLTGAPYTISLSDVGMEVAVCIEINASDVEFDCQGYSITNNGTNAADGSVGILIDANRQNVTVKNCFVSNYSHGIATYKASNNYIYNNTAYNNTDFGIILFYFSNDNVISNNSLYENSKGGGAYVYSASNNFTYNNIYNNSQVGILLLQYSDTGYIHNNIIENHTDPNAMGVYIDSSLNCLISDNLFRNNYNHIYASTTTVTRILNNNMSLSQNNGVYITDSSFVNTSNNIIYGAANGMGILYNNTHYGYIASNIINESFTGIFLNYSNSNLLIDNIVYNNSKNGIEIFESDQNNLLNNTAYLNAEQGFIVSSSDYINISGGESYNNSYSGYFLIATTQSVIRNVTSYNNTQHGVMLDSSGNNNITNNILVDNLYSGVHIVDSSDDNFITFNKIENPNAQYGGIYSLASVRIYIYNNTINNSRIGVNLVDSNTMFIADNNITNNSIMGIYFNPNTMSVEISNNYVCFNDRMDINNSASYSYTNTGQLDRCDYWYNWSENNHYGCEYSCSGLWHRFFGSANGTIYLTDNDSATDRYLFKWTGASLKNVYFADSDAVIDWQQLQAIGRTTSNTPSSNDFVELDNALLSSSFPDNIQTTYSTDGSTPKETVNYSVYGRDVYYVPVANSTLPDTIFKTGIMWDMSDGGTEYDGSQSTVWVVKPQQNEVEDAYGVYNYLAMIPYTLATSEGSTDTVTIYLEIE
ncbi:MAG: right-handed parallel beta-helix repeat-containing protein, partial [Candidatus Bilamarchaeaceae archaeon]